MYSEKATKFCEIFPLLLTAVHTAKLRGRFRKIWWPSQNILTLKTNDDISRLFSQNIRFLWTMFELYLKDITSTE